MNAVLRPARSTDAGKIGALISDSAARTPWKPRLRSGAEDIALSGRMIDNGWVTVVEDRDTGDVSGFLARQAGYVHALFVAFHARGTGLGLRLLDHAMTGQARLDLWTFQANDTARRFYMRAGFVEWNRRDGTHNDEGLAEIHYRWTRKEPT